MKDNRRIIAKLFVSKGWSPSPEIIDSILFNFGAVPAAGPGKEQMFSSWKQGPHAEIFVCCQIEH